MRRVFYSLFFLSLLVSCTSNDPVKVLEKLQKEADEIFSCSTNPEDPFAIYYLNGDVFYTKLEKKAEPQKLFSYDSEIEICPLRWAVKEDRSFVPRLEKSEKIRFRDIRRVVSSIGTERKMILFIGCGIGSAYYAMLSEPTKFYRVEDLAQFSENITLRIPVSGWDLLQGNELTEYLSYCKEDTPIKESFSLCGSLLPDGSIQLSGDTPIVNEGINIPVYDYETFGALSINEAINDAIARQYNCQNIEQFQEMLDAQERARIAEQERLEQEQKMASLRASAVNASDIIHLYMTNSVKAEKKYPDGKVMIVKAKVEELGRSNDEDFKYILINDISSEIKLRIHTDDERFVNLDYPCTVIFKGKFELKNLGLFFDNDYYFCFDDAKLLL